MLTWVNRITRIQVREPDLFGKWASRWQVIRTSNAYRFRRSMPAAEGRRMAGFLLSRKIPLEHRIEEIQSLTLYQRE